MNNFLKFKLPTHPILLDMLEISHLSSQAYVRTRETLSTIFKIAYYKIMEIHQCDDLVLKDYYDREAFDFYMSIADLLNIGTESFNYLRLGIADFLNYISEFIFINKLYLNRLEGADVHYSFTILYISK